ncbi:alpha/beta hydrolase [Caulobacter sp. NIBR1757]|uniref:alpha/beta fold hydrolase n=1 Tax=Caulobacter sp. NIBR1757 TaxID=3016000 RepID=UPI0022F0CA2C|nr:alpha/beta hydrolase [Caulobacter sp. NIBR1757]WGM37446.1 Aclacinomycin methylesterase RdmC [Caulobacter sp. NIBR1757]
MPQLSANGITIEYDERGSGDPLLLIMGLGAQMTRWPEGFCDQLAARGFRVIRFDNRDIGLSSKMDEAGLPDMAAVFTAFASGQPAPVAYTLQEMSEDAVGVLDALGIEKAHIVGASMGGMIAQLVAADFPGHTLSLTSIMSTTGNRDLPTGTPEAMAALSTPAPSPHDDMEGFLAAGLKTAHIVGSPGHVDEAALRERMAADVQRSYYPAGFMRQYAAVLASPDRRPKLKGVKAPTVVIHGDADTLVNVAGAHDTAENIPGAELLIIPGMGHDVPPVFWGQIVEAIEAVASKAKAEA